MKFEILNPTEIKRDLEAAEWASEDRFTLTRAVFLGTVFALYPSGKYYTAWACSNLDSCETCDGKGSIPNKQHDPKAHSVYREERRLLTQTALKEYGAWCNGEWPAEVSEKAERLDRLCRESEATIECPDCHGVGSAEAYQDQVFGEQLEDEAEALGLFIMSGDGDPCDVFIAQSIDIPELNCPHCGNEQTKWVENQVMRCSECEEEFEFEAVGITIPSDEHDPEKEV